MSAEIVLGLDTATDHLSVAVAKTKGPVIREEERGPGEDGNPRHSAQLLVALEACVADAGGWDAIGRVAIGVGPGSYTGLRIGIATARALAQARGLALAGVSSLSALAAGIGELDPERAALAVLDARRGEVFAALHGPDGEELRGPFVSPPEELAEWVAELEPFPLAAGGGSVRFRAELEAAGATVAPDRDPVHRVHARHVCALGAGAPASGPDRIRPIYLREPDAKRWIERDAHGAD